MNNLSLDRTLDPNGGNGSVAGRLACEGIRVRFGGLMAVNDVSLAVPPGSIVGLVGPNGAGKSTLFAVMSGLMRPSSGRVFMEGDDVTESSPQDRAERGLARTFQHPELFAGLTVREHLTLAYRVRHERNRVWSDLFTMGSLHKQDPSERTAVDELIDLLELGPVAGRTGTGVPLGYARLVELGRALASGPRVLLLDEPSSGLDTVETERFESTLRRVVEERHISVLLVEHDVELVMRMCGTINVLDFGSLIACGTPREVRENPKVRSAYLGEDTAPGPVPAESPDHPVQGVIAIAEQEEASTPTGEAGRTDSGTLVRAEAVSVLYGDALALKDVSFDLRAGRALAVIGANGAGKSSLARALCGLVEPRGGRVLLDGQRIDRWSADRIRRAGLVYLPEGRGVFPSLSVLDNVKMAANAVPGRSARREAVDRAMELFPVLGARRGQLAGSLSGGEQQMLSLARGLATVPKVVVADEMSLGLAPKLVDMVFDGLGTARSMGVSVIMIEQYVHRALAFADDCLLLQRGSTAWAGPASKAGEELLGRYLGSAMSAEM